MTEISNIKILQMHTNRIAAFCCPGSILEEKVSLLQADLRYSDPVSPKALLASEVLIDKELDRLEELLCAPAPTREMETKAAEQLDFIRSLLAARNRDCRLLKQN